MNQLNLAGAPTARGLRWVKCACASPSPRLIDVAHGGLNISALAALLDPRGTLLRGGPEGEGGVNGEGGSKSEGGSQGEGGSKGEGGVSKGEGGSQNQTDGCAVCGAKRVYEEWVEEGAWLVEGGGGADWLGRGQEVDVSGYLETLEWAALM